MTDKNKLFKSIRERLALLVDKEANQIKDAETRRLFKSSIMGSAHLEPGTHEPAEVGVPEHMEPGMHEATDLGDAAPPVGDSQPVAGGLGLPGDELNGGGEENGTVDLCPLCGNEDVPGVCTCLAKNDTLGGGETGVMNAPLARSEPCRKCGEMHGNLQKCGDMRSGASPIKKSVDSPASIPDPKNKGLPKDKPGKEIKNPGNGGKAANKPKENTSRLKKVAVPAAKPPSGKIPGGTSAPPMASNNSMPKVGTKPPAAPTGAPKPPGLGKAALPANKDQMRQHALSDASRAAAKSPAAGPTPAPKLTNPNDMGRAHELASQMSGPSFQPQAAPKLAGLKPPSSPASGSAKPRSLFSSLFGPKGPKSA